MLSRDHHTSDFHGLGMIAADNHPGAFALSRRRVIVGTSSVVAAAVLLSPDWLGAAAHATQPINDPGRAILRAYMSTLVPGPGDDPAGTPGAVEAGAVEQLEARVPYVIPPLLADLTAAALTAHGQDFASLSYDERESLLVDAFADSRRAPYHLIALAVGAGSFYGDFRNRVGGAHLGFPGPSNGYLATYTDGTGHGQPQAEAVPA